MGMKWSGGRTRRKAPPGSNMINRLGARLAGIMPGVRQIPLRPRFRRKKK